MRKRWKTWQRKHSKTRSITLQVCLSVGLISSPGIVVVEGVSFPASTLRAGFAQEVFVFIITLTVNSICKCNNLLFFILMPLIVVHKQLSFYWSYNITNALKHPFSHTVNNISSNSQKKTNTKKHQSIITCFLSVYEVFKD